MNPLNFPVPQSEARGFIFHARWKTFFDSLDFTHQFFYTFCFFFLSSFFFHFFFTWTDASFAFFFILMLFLPPGPGNPRWEAYLEGSTPPYFPCEAWILRLAWKNLLPSFRLPLLRFFLKLRTSPTFHAFTPR